jgi:hypothetical protein
MSATIRTSRTVYEVYGKLQETAPILAWIADQAPSAQLKFDVDVHGREQRVTQWFEFSVSFENDTDEVNFKMFQSEAFEAGAEQVIPPLKPLPGTVMIGTKPTFYSIFDEVQVPRKPMSFKVGK